MIGQTDASGSVLLRRNDEIHADILRHFQDFNVSADAKAEIEDDLRAAEKAMAKIETREAYLNALADYVAEAKEDLESGERDPLEKPLCSCDRVYCPLKKGELPDGVVGSDRVDDGVLSWKRDHRGDAAVLTEARDKFIEDAIEARSTLRSVKVRLERERE
jgi:hypothetical protein